MFTQFLLRLTALRGLRADLAALALGALSAAALPPVHAVPVLLICVPGLLALLDSTRGPLGAARRGWWFGVGHHVFGLYWITEAILFEAARFWWLVPLAVPATAAVLAVFIAAAAGAARLASPGWPRAVALAGAWVLADIARQFVLTGFPWNPWGSVWEFPGAVGDVFIQPAAWVGVHGLTLATLLLAAVPALGWRWRIGGAVVLAGWIAVGMVRLAAPLPEAPGVDVALVQGNVAQGQKWDQEFAMRILRRYLALTAQAAADRPDRPIALIWPETSFPGWLQTDDLARRVILEAAKGQPAFIGGIRMDEAGRPRNSLFVLGDGGAITAVYDKWHLVPFGEYIPIWLPLPLMVLPGGGFASGPGPRTLHVPGLPPVGVMICYEAIFSGLIVDRADRPGWLVNVTNDAWFGNSSGPRQHLAAARMRAVEEGLPVVRVANTGISAVFDARGHQIARLEMQQTGTSVTALPAGLPDTPFARFGLAVPLIASMVALGVGVMAYRFAARG